MTSKRKSHKSSKRKKQRKFIPPNDIKEENKQIKDNNVDNMSDSDEDVNYAEQIEEFDEAELDKLILRNNNPVFTSPTFDMNNDQVNNIKQIGKGKILPMNRIIKNNNESQDNKQNVFREVKQIQNKEREDEIKSQQVETFDEPTTENNESTSNEDKEVDTQSEQDKSTNNDTIKYENTQSEQTKDKQNKTSTKNIKYYSPSRDLLNSLHNSEQNDFIDECITLYPDDVETYKINKKVFRICYLTIVCVMLIILLFIIILQSFKKYLMQKQQFDNKTNLPNVVQGGQTQSSALDEIINKNIDKNKEVIFEDCNQCLRDSKGRFVKKIIS